MVAHFHIPAMSLSVYHQRTILKDEQFAHLRQQLDSPEPFTPQFFQRRQASGLLVRHLLEPEPPAIIAELQLFVTSE